MHRQIKKLPETPKPVFLACSALREAYRQRLRNGLPRLTFIYLKGSKKCIAKRLAGRTGHFMAPELFKSQFATLEEPSDAIMVAIDKPLPELADEIARKIGVMMKSTATQEYDKSTYI